MYLPANFGRRAACVTLFMLFSPLCRAEAPLTTGPLRPAIAASIAIPGLLRPVAIDGRVLIDGGTTNPLPFDRLRSLADFVVAIDVLGMPPAAERDDIPGMWESKAGLVVQRIRQIGTNRLLYGSDAATADNLPKDALKRWHSLPLTTEEFGEIENNVAPYVRNWLLAEEPQR